MLYQKFKEYFRSLTDKLLNFKERKKLIGLSTYVVMVFISFTMSVINVFTDVGLLLYATAGMTVLSAVNLFLALKTEKGVKIAENLFFVEIIALFTFFVVSGNPKGFSIIWLSLLPPIGMIFYGRKKGTLFSVVMFIILIFFLWTPAGKGLLMQEAVENYSETFCLRFPFLYVACCLLAYILALLQNIAFDGVERSREKYKYLMKHDYLTGLYNRSGLLTIFKSEVAKQEKTTVGIGVLDIDKFKDVNDKYGHYTGDIVLKKFAEELKKNDSILACRWGGDEFAFIYFDVAVADNQLVGFKEHIKNTPIMFPEGENIEMTFSCGLYETTMASLHNEDDIEECIKKADELLYKAKQSGRNAVFVQRRNEAQIVLR